MAVNTHSGPGAVAKFAPVRFVQGATRAGTIRPMTVADLALVTEIESRAYSHPWELGVFRDCLRAGYYAQVLTQDRLIRGYSIVSVAAGEAHLLNLCIDPLAHRRGYGRLLLDHLLDVVRRTNAGVLFLEVRPSNRAAITLYRTYGFERIGVRKGYYPALSGREDAHVYAHWLDVEPGLACSSAASPR